MHLFSILAIVLPVTSALAADVEARYYNNPPKCGVQGYDKARPGKGERGGHVLGIGIDHILRLFVRCSLQATSEVQKLRSQSQEAAMSTLRSCCAGQLQRRQIVAVDFL